MVERTGVERISEVFRTTRSENRAALMPYLTMGFPTPEKSVALAQTVAAAGADMLELGVPFSDPLADGPVIQRATHLALQQGTTVHRCLELAQDLRRSRITVPFAFMGYYNPIIAYGERAFCRRCRDIGVDGLIVPDLPPEEGEALEGECREHGLALIYLLAPTSPPERMRLVAERSQGFVYLVSVTGVTGARKRVPPDLAAFVKRVRAVTDKPLAVGFGISTPAQARQVAGLADGVVFGSALVRLSDKKDAIERAGDLTSRLRRAVETERQDPGPAIT